MTQREVLRRVLEEERDIAVAAEGRNGREGLERALAVRPDVVVADVWMPEMDAEAMTRAILAELGVPIVVISERFARDGRDMAVACLAAGALMAIEKPRGPAIAHLAAMGGELRRAVRDVAEIRIRRRSASSSQPGATSAASLDEAAAHGTEIAAIGIAASTGGPQVLTEILGALPAEYPIPILLVQHISAGFEMGFCRWLSDETRLPIRLARPALPLQPGVTLARQGAHMILGRDDRLALVDPCPGEYYAPSADPLFRSLADALGASAAGVVLSGMGEDGAAGLEKLRASGGVTIAQSEETSLIWGMPGAAVKRGAALVQASPPEIAAFLARLPDRALRAACAP